MANGKFIAYYRVSTARQGRSGLGLEGQQEAVRHFLNGGNWNLIAEVTEVESGKRNNRPKLAEALSLCRLHKATLIIAKMDRLARNVFFISSLMESGVDFIAVDNPTANRLTVHVLAAVAEADGIAISERTKAALGAAKARGVKLGGNRNPARLNEVRALGIAASAEVRSAKADQRAKDVAPMVNALVAKGCSLNAVAVKLNQDGIPTPRGNGAWTAKAVSRLLARVA